jgi:hypothetical protein
MACVRWPLPGNKPKYCYFSAVFSPSGGLQFIDSGHAGIPRTGASDGPIIDPKGGRRLFFTGVRCTFFALFITF